MLCSFPPFSHHQCRSCRLHLCLRLWGMLLSHRQSDLCPPWKSPSVQTWEKYMCAGHKLYTVCSLLSRLRLLFMCLCAFVSVWVPHLSSSSSMKPLPSTSRTWKTFLTFSADMAFIPTISKNFLGSNVSATKGKTEGTNRTIKTTSTFKLACLKCFLKLKLSASEWMNEFYHSTHRE